MEFVHGILELVRNKCLHDNLYCDLELQVASIYAIVDDIPHVPT